MIFAVFDTVLSELNSSGEDAFGDKWPAAVAEAAEALSAYYGNQNLRNPNRKLVEYGGLATQAAYIFMYAIGRADFTYQLLTRFRQLAEKPLFDKATLNVTSIGGGPASELVGLVRYLEHAPNGENVFEIIYEVIDKEGEWNDVVDLVVESIDSEIGISADFKQVDLTDAQSSSQISLTYDDLVMISFLISEVCELPNPKVVRSNIENILRTIKVGAKLLYNDSDAYSFYSYMNSRARAVKGLTEIYEIQDTIAMDYSDPCEIYDDYSEILGKVPHLSSKAVSKLYERVAT